MQEKTEVSSGSLEAGEVQAHAPSCAVCDGSLAFHWTDTHGVGVCSHCGALYTVLHCEGKERVNKPAECALSPEGVALAKRWAEHKRMVYPGACDMGFLGGRNYTYSGATRDDIRAFEEWYVAQPEVIAARATGEAA
jgi:hypothetical protein